MIRKIMYLKTNFVCPILQKLRVGLLSFILIDKQVIKRVSFIYNRLQFLRIYSKQNSFTNCKKELGLVLCKAQFFHQNDYKFMIPQSNTGVLRGPTF